MISPGMGCCEHTLNTLRYADRVKELGPGGPVEGKPAEINLADNYNNLGAMSPQNSALALLKTANVGQLLIRTMSPQNSALALLKTANVGQLLIRAMMSPQNSALALLKTANVGLAVVRAIMHALSRSSCLN